MPESDLPFEFNYKTGSIVVDDGVIIQSVSSDGSTVLKTKSPQPMKKYYSNNNKNMNTFKKPHDTGSAHMQTYNNVENAYKTQEIDNNYKLNSLFNVYPSRYNTITSYASSLSDYNPWIFFQNSKKYVK